MKTQLITMDLELEDINLTINNVIISQDEHGEYTILYLNTTELGLVDIHDTYLEDDHIDLIAQEIQ